jgi:integrase
LWVQMVRTYGRLAALAVSKARKPGLYADGGGLYLQISGAHGRSWVFRYMLRGKARTMGLGPAEDVTLAVARATARDCRLELRAGFDPIEARKARHAKATLEAAHTITFRACAEAYIEAHKPGWRNAKHAAQWSATLAGNAYPVFGAMPVQQIDVGLIVRILEPIWATKTETATRVRGRIESVLDWARTRGYRTGDNPARWRGHLENLLPKRSRVRKVKHYPALPYADASAFMANLRNHGGMSALALEFLILTAARTGEVLGATWDEVDLEAEVWTIPATRIKAGREHRVPLSGPALAVLRRLYSARQSAYIFPGVKAGRPLSGMALLMALRGMGRGDLTVHGFRSSFRMWAAEQTNIAREVAEQALAHSLSDKVEAAYQRSDFFDKRRRLMNDWARFCEAPAAGGQVVAMRRASK